MLTDMSVGSESLSKVCQEELFHPLLSAISNDSLAEVPHMNSNDGQALPTASPSPAQSTCSSDKESLISTASNTSPSYSRHEGSTSTASQNNVSPISIINQGNVSTASMPNEDKEITVAHQTVSTTIPSHPSTIQYIPIIQTPITQSESNPLNVRTVHLISATVASQNDTATTTENVCRPSTIHYQYVPSLQQNRNTIHYPPGNIQIIHSGSSLIMSSNSLITAALQSVTATGNEINSNTQSTSGNNFLQIIPSSSTTTQNSTLVRNIQVMSLASEEQNDTSGVAASSESNTSTSAISDHNIRVLTPSEIMKTLPSLGQESFDVTSTTVSSIAVQ